MNRSLPLIGFLSASVFFHSTLFFSLDRFYENAQGQVLKRSRDIEKKEKLEFQFVEARPKVIPDAPKESRRISERDALNQDLLQDKSKAAVSPRTKTQGATDQLAQQKNESPQEPAPLIEEKPAFIEPVSPKAQDGVPAAVSATSQEAMKPKPRVVGLTGQDKITTQEMSKLKSPGAALFGQTSFEATGSGMGAYMKNLKEKVWLAWFPYLAFRYPQDHRGADVVISFTLNASGELEMVRVLQSEGSPHFAVYCVEAIQRASPFGPLPSEILALVGKDELEIRFGFHYY
ncbi:MAG: TonB family protein [Candidatus Omnitrophica bacterium]|nr:TonB family protein [Candidatus Omnitrophota bacterium]